ncbi:hypothetical protein FRB91_000091 [Serendipita sp. 411]|nr:hypothetical protein FRC15_009350 [Serendipita sp. 397]KAG8861847.1 hypothetical protein FRB91_000091 [Serendipita sp. 411]
MTLSNGLTSITSFTSSPYLFHLLPLVSNVSSEEYKEQYLAKSPPGKDAKAIKVPADDNGQMF